MSLYVYGRIKEKCLDVNLLEKYLIEFFAPHNTVVKRLEGRCITYDNVDDERKMEISFSCRNEGLPYNVYDSDIFGEFEYEQLIIFDLDKEKATVACHQQIIQFLMFLNGKTGSDILITSDAHNEICMLSLKGVVWKENSPFKDLF